VVLSREEVNRTAAPASARSFSFRARKEGKRGKKANAAGHAAIIGNFAEAFGAIEKIDCYVRNDGSPASGAIRLEISSEEKQRERM